MARDRITSEAQDRMTSEGGPPPTDSVTSTRARSRTGDAGLGMEQSVVGQEIDPVAPNGRSQTTGRPDLDNWNVVAAQMLVADRVVAKILSSPLPAQKSILREWLQLPR